MNAQTKVRVPSPTTEMELPQEAQSVGAVTVMSQRAPQVRQSERATDDGAARPMYPIKLVKAILAVTKQIGAVEKLGLNKDQNYTYQRWDDVLARLSVILPENGLLIVQSQTGQTLFEGESLVSITYDFLIMNDEGDVWPEPIKWSAAAKVRAKTGTVDDKAITKAHTQAEKYFFVKFFKIRSIEMPDSDAGEEPGDNAAPQRQRPRVPSPNDAPDESELKSRFMAQCREKIAAFMTGTDIDTWWKSEELGNQIDGAGLNGDEVYAIQVAAVERKRAIRVAEKPADETKTAKSQPAIIDEEPGPYDDLIEMLERDYSTAIDKIESRLWGLRAKSEELDAFWQAVFDDHVAMYMLPDRERLLRELAKIKSR